MTKQTVLQAVRAHLQSHQRRWRNFAIEVVEEGVRREGHWWYVPVRSSRELPSLYRYYEELVEVEREVKQELGNKTEVLLVPCV